VIESFGHQVNREEAQDLRNTDIVVVNSAKDIKFYYLWVLLQSMARGDQAIHLIEGQDSLERSIPCPQIEHYQEPKCLSAIESSNDKAEYLNQWFSEVMTSGADSVFKIFNQETNKWEVFHKIGRGIIKSPEENIVSEYQNLKELLVYPKSGVLYLLWELSATYKNGYDHHFPESLVVKSKTLDLELFKKYFDHSIKSGLFWKSSTRIALIEAVLENDSTTNIGIFTDKQLQDRQTNIWNNLQRIDTFLKDLSTHAVLSTVPLGTFLNDNKGQIFEKARDIAQNIGLVKDNETFS
jgi:hypothetical protein